MFLALTLLGTVLSVKGCGVEVALRFTEIFCNSEELEKFLNEKILNTVAESPCCESYNHFWQSSASWNRLKSWKAK